MNAQRSNFRWFDACRRRARRFGAVVPARSCHLRPSRGRNGVYLLFFVVLIPLALLLLIGEATRVEFGLREARRTQARAQARLLAESALALWAAEKPAAGRPVVQDLPGVGRAELAIKEEAPGGRLLVARGSCVDRQDRFVCEIAAQEPASSGGERPTPLAMTQSVLEGASGNSVPAGTNAFNRPR
jgi:hypothetical protein